MPLRGRRNHYQKLIVSEQGRLIGLREGGFSVHDIAERLARNVSIVLDFDSSGQGMVQPQKERVSGGLGALLKGETAVFGVWPRCTVTASVAEVRAAVGTTVTQCTVRNRLFQRQLQARHPVACVPLTPSHCLLRRHWCQARACWRFIVFSGESRLCLRTSDGHVLVRRRSENACNRTVCGLDTLDLHLESWSGEQFSMTAGIL
ncbi:transposable element Tc1 transposase [Trichonephila clavipes]|nr:transposable element Tc1 transposase [Trichonephila clavipes]